MKYLKQFGVILVISFIGEVLKFVIPLPVPASIYGLVLLFLALCFGIIKVEQVKEVSDFLIVIMPIMFVPAGVGLVQSWGEIETIVIPILVITVVSTILVMGVTGQVTQWLIQKQKGEKA